MLGTGSSSGGRRGRALPGTLSGTLSGALLVTLVALTTGASAQVGGEPPRRHVALPGLESHQLLVDPSVEWYDRALAALDKAYPSFVIVQSTERPDEPPLSGFVIGERHVITAHLDEVGPGEPAPRFLIRTVEGSIVEGVQVAAWEKWDFGVIEVPEPLPVPPVEFGDERTTRRGDPVISIGNPAAAGRDGLALVGIGSFVEPIDGYVRNDISSAAGGSGGPVFDLDGRLIGMSSFGIQIPVVGIDRMAVSELRLRSAVPIDRGPGEAGAGASTIASLTGRYRP